MAGTYSKYIGTTYDALSSNLILSNDGTQSYAFNNNYVYTNLLDNTSKIISPKALRDAILSLWDSNPFKEIATGSNVYIGVDSGNPNDIDIKKPIFFGKRNYRNTEIISSQLLANRYNDIYFYNTRPDGLDINQDSTNLIFLSGTNSGLYLRPNIISSQYVIGTTASSLGLSIVNNSNFEGDINFLSQGIDPFTKIDTNSGGTVSINNLNFPTIQDSQSVNLNKKALVWNNGGFEWTELTYPYSDWAGATGSELNIYGSQVNSNGYSLEFTDERMIPTKFGDIKPGETFSSVSLLEMMNRIIYDYIPPKCSLTLNTDQYLEVGTEPEIILSYKIYKNTEDLFPTKLINMIPSQVGPISSDGQVVITGQAEGVVIVPLNPTYSEFTIKVSDGTTSNSITKSISGVYPYYYGFSTQSTINVFELSSLTKKIESKGDKEYDITGSGNFFFIYDKDYGTLSNIYNNTGATISASFSYSVEVLSSPEGYWQSKEFYVYKWNGVTQIGPPSEMYEFKY